MPRDSGFTLLEMIVVVAILGIVGGVLLTRGPPRSGAADMRAATTTVAGAFRTARGRAIAGNRVVPVHLDRDARAVAVESDPPTRLPGGIGFVAGPALMLFRPDGGASGGTVRLAGENREAQVDVNWLTGRVAIP